MYDLFWFFVHLLGDTTEEVDSRKRLITLYVVSYKQTKKVENEKDRGEQESGKGVNGPKDVIEDLPEGKEYSHRNN